MSGVKLSSSNLHRHIPFSSLFSHFLTDKGKKKPEKKKIEREREREGGRGESQKQITAKLEDKNEAYKSVFGSWVIHHPLSLSPFFRS